jgi:thiol-disulfide isomerase/thioredoxin
MPSLGGATEWLDTEPLGPAELRGHVVLVNFWTWTCISWLRHEPYVRAWSQAYRNDGLVVIGVHTVANAVQDGIIGDDDSVTGGVWAHPPSSCSTVLSPWCCFGGPSSGAWPKGRLGR